MEATAYAGGMGLDDVYSEAARRSDTSGTKINVAEVSRVGAVLFDVWCELPAELALRLFARGIELAKGRKAGN